MYDSPSFILIIFVHRLQMKASTDICYIHLQLSSNKSTDRSLYNTWRLSTRSLYRFQVGDPSFPPRPCAAQGAERNLAQTSQPGVHKPIRRQLWCWEGRGPAPKSWRAWHLLPPGWCPSGGFATPGAAHHLRRPGIVEACRRRFVGGASIYLHPLQHKCHRLQHRILRGAPGRRVGSPERPLGLQGRSDHWCARAGGWVSRPSSEDKATPHGIQSWN